MMKAGRKNFETNWGRLTEEEPSKHDMCRASIQNGLPEVMHNEHLEQKESDYCQMEAAVFFMHSKISSKST